MYFQNFLFPFFSFSFSMRFIFPEDFIFELMIQLRVFHARPCHGSELVPTNDQINRVRLQTQTLFFPERAMATVIHWLAPKCKASSPSDNPDKCGVRLAIWTFKMSYDGES